MNYLAHLLLAEPTPLSRLGNILPDLWAAPLRTAPNLPELRQAMDTHLAVDRFTDAHPRFRDSADRLRPQLRRFAGVLVDILYDHVLATTWDRYCPLPLEAFAESVYADVAAVDLELPEHVQTALERMRTHRWLTMYRERDGIRLALARTEDRLQRRVPLVAALDDFDADRAGFRADFAAFFPELQAFVRSRPTA